MLRKEERAVLVVQWQSEPLCGEHKRHREVRTANDEYTQPEESLKISKKKNNLSHNSPCRTAESTLNT